MSTSTERSLDTGEIGTDAVETITEAPRAIDLHEKAEVKVPGTCSSLKALESINRSFNSLIAHNMFLSRIQLIVASLTPVRFQ